MRIVAQPQAVAGGLKLPSENQVAAWAQRQLITNVCGSRLVVACCWQPANDHLANRHQGQLFGRTATYHATMECKHLTVSLNLATDLC